MAGKREAPSSGGRRAAPGSAPQANRSRPPQNNRSRASQQAHFEHYDRYDRYDHRDRAPSGGRNYPRKRKKAGMRRWQKVVITILVLIIVLMITAVALVWAKLGRIGRIGDESRIDASQEEFEVDENAGEDTLSGVDFTPAEVNAHEDVINILLVGRDARDKNERGRTDSMIVLSLNRKTQQISMVSLMRDTYVAIPGYSDNKLNASYSFGGYELLDETISQNYGIEIDYNVGVNFEGFKDVIDQLGGIDITLTAAEAEYINQDIDNAPGTSCVAGVNHLSGTNALVYARARAVGTGQEANDFGRTYRQRMVLTTVYKELMTKPLTEIWTIMDSIMDCVQTDMTNTEIVSIGTEFYNMGIDSMQSYRLPCDNEYTDETINRMAVLNIDWDKARAHLQEWLYSDTPVEDNSLTTAN